MGGADLDHHEGPFTTHLESKDVEFGNSATFLKLYLDYKYSWHQSVLQSGVLFLYPQAVFVAAALLISPLRLPKVHANKHSVVRRGSVVQYSCCIALQDWAYTSTVLHVIYSWFQLRIAWTSRKVLRKYCGLRNVHAPLISCSNFVLALIEWPAVL